jgi:hypothetical protein
MFVGQSVPKRVYAVSISMSLLTELGWCFGCSSSIDMPLLTELFRGAFPPETAKNPALSLAVSLSGNDQVKPLAVFLG